METIVGSLLSGVAQVLGKIFGHPFDFLSGKSCDTICGLTWDLMCYIENFCVAHLVKLAMVFILLYFVLLFFYLLYKLGICYCISHTIWRIIWACFAACFNMLYCCCTCLCNKLEKHNQKRRKQLDADIEELAFSSQEEDSERSFSSCQATRRRRRSLSHRRDHKREHLRKSLRPKNHRVHVGVSGNLIHVNKRYNSINKDHDHVSSPIHHIRVTRTSKFAQKAPHHKGSIHHPRHKLLKRVRY